MTGYCLSADFSYLATEAKREMVLWSLLEYAVPIINGLTSSYCLFKVYAWPGRFPSYPSYPYLGYFPVTVTSMHP